MWYFLVTDELTKKAILGVGYQEIRRNQSGGRKSRMGVRYSVKKCQLMRILWLSVRSGYSEKKRVGGEIVEQGWIVSVPWGIVPRGDLLLQRGEEEKECHEFSKVKNGKKM